MSTPIKLTANRYELAYHKLLNDLPSWKRNAIKEDMINKVDNHILDEFCKEVVTLAEMDQKIFTTTE